jgi:hypothetical protein
LDGATCSWSLFAAAFRVGISLTLLGRDRDLPFVMLAEARGWSLLRTAVITFVCELGPPGRWSHVIAGSVIAAAGLPVIDLGL